MHAYSYYLRGKDHFLESFKNASSWGSCYINCSWVSPLTMGKKDQLMIAWVLGSTDRANLERYIAPGEDVFALADRAARLI